MKRYSIIILLYLPSDFTNLNIFFVNLINNRLRGYIETLAYKWVSKSECYKLVDKETVNSNADIIMKRLKERKIKKAPLKHLCSYYIEV